MATTLALVHRQNDDSGAVRLAAMIEDVARTLVDDPDGVSVKIDYRGAETCLSLFVAPNDLGKVIGRQGRTARSLRTILGAAAQKQERVVSLSLEVGSESR